VVAGKGHVAGHIGRRGLNLRRKTVALLQRLHFKAVHLVDDAVELVGELRIASDIDAARQHHVDCAIELGLGLRKLAAAIVGVAARISGLHLLDELLDALLLGGRWRGCCGSGR